MAIGNMHKKFGEIQSYCFQVMRVDRQTDVIVAILHILLGVKY